MHEVGQRRLENGDARREWRGFHFRPGRSDMLSFINPALKVCKWAKGVWLQLWIMNVCATLSLGGEWMASGDEEERRRRCFWNVEERERERRCAQDLAAYCQTSEEEAAASKHLFEKDFRENGTLEIAYRVAICPKGNLPYIQTYPINNTICYLIYPVGSWMHLQWSAKVFFLGCVTRPCA